MISPRNKLRLENLRRISGYYSDLAIDHPVPDPVVAKGMNEDGTIVYYRIYKEFERDGKLSHDLFAVTYAHTGEVVFYRREEDNRERTYSINEFKNGVMPNKFLMEIDDYIGDVLKMIGSPP